MPHQDVHNGSELLAILVSTHFPPASSDCQATWRTTSEIFEVLDEHMPSTFTPSELALHLHHNGYSRRLVGEELRWGIRALGR